MGIFAPFSFLEQKVVDAGIPVQPEATAFLSAAGITDPTITDAVNELVYDMKQAGIYTKMKAIYPYVGGTASTHKWNLKDPRDLDAAYRLTFVGVNHSSDGITGQGGGVNNRGAFTHINISTDLSQNDVHFTTYINNNPTNVEPESHDMGAISGGNGMQFGSISPTTGNAFGKLMNNTNDEFANSDARGFYQLSRTSSSGFAFQKNTTRQTNSLTSQAPPSNEYICITALGVAETSSVRQSIKRHAFSSVGSGLSTSEMDDYYTLVQKFQTTLGREV